MDAPVLYGIKKKKLITLRRHIRLPWQVPIYVELGLNWHVCI